MSNHAAVTGSFVRVLARLLGDEHTFTLAAPGYPSFTWTFNWFSDATAQVKEARIWGGIHFRISCNAGAAQAWPSVLPAGSAGRAGGRCDFAGSFLIFNSLALFLTRMRIDLQNSQKAQSRREILCAQIN